MSEQEAKSPFPDLDLSVEVWFGTEKVVMQSLLELQPGGVLALSHDPDDPLDLVVNGVVLASGELVVVEGKFGFRVTSTTQQKLAKLGGEPSPH